jgi:hypothetical protein
MNAWEVTTEDTETVLKAHDVALPEKEVANLVNRINKDSVVQTVLAYADFDDQCHAALCDIERQLSKLGVINSEMALCPPQSCFVPLGRAGCSIMLVAL